MQSARAQDGPPSDPRVVLRVGITGHRRLPPAHLDGIRAALRDLLARIRDHALACLPPTDCETEERPRLRFVSPLAEGADQLGAQVALSLGYDLQCPLPFAAEAYIDDFAPGSEARRLFEHLRAEASAVLELDGKRSSDEERRAAYEAVGRAVQAQSDLLVTVWDGKPETGRGGTGQVAREALVSGTPVLVIPPDAPAVPRLLVSWRDGREVAGAFDALGAQVQSLVLSRRVGEADG